MRFCRVAKAQVVFDAVVTPAGALAAVVWRVGRLRGAAEKGRRVHGNPCALIVGASNGLESHEGGPAPAGVMPVSGGRPRRGAGRRRSLLAEHRLPPDVVAAAVVFDRFVFPWKKGFASGVLFVVSDVVELGPSSGVLTKMCAAAPAHRSATRSAPNLCTLPTISSGLSHHRVVCAKRKPFVRTAGPEAAPRAPVFRRGRYRGRARRGLAHVDLVVRDDSSAWRFGLEGCLERGHGRCKRLFDDGAAAKFVVQQGPIGPLRLAERLFVFIVLGLHHDLLAVVVDDLVGLLRQHLFESVSVWKRLVSG